MNLENKLIGKIQSVYFKINMFIKGLLKVPAQTGKEMRLFKKIFLDYSDREIKIFEWGSGRSTIYYSEYLRKKGGKFEWHTLDNNKSWFNKVKEDIKKSGLENNVTNYLKEFPPFWEKPEWGEVPPPCGVFSPKTENELAYIDMPRTMNMKFDIIIIDARFRRHCLKVAKDLIATGGVVVIHDAQKPHYHEGLDHFTHRKFYKTGWWYPFQELPNEIWVGAMENKQIFKVLEGF